MKVVRLRSDGEGIRFSVGVPLDYVRKLKLKKGDEMVAVIERINDVDCVVFRKVEDFYAVKKK